MNAEVLSMQPWLSTIAHNYGLWSREHAASSVVEYADVTACQQSTALTVTRYWLQYSAFPAPSLGDYSAGAFDVFVRTINHIGERKLVHPLTAYAERDGDSFIAHTHEFEQVYGAGDSSSDSFEDLELCLVDLFEDLSDMRVPYSTEWEQVRAHLNELVGE